MFIIAKAALYGRIDGGEWIEDEINFKWKWQTLPWNIGIVKFRSFINSVSANFKTYFDPVIDAVERDILFIDDMTCHTRNGNTESPYRWAGEAMRGLIDAWWDTGKGALYITSNNNADEIAEIYGDAFMDRIRGICDAIEVTGKSYR